MARGAATAAATVVVMSNLEMDEADLPYINEYCQQLHKGVVTCEYTQDKGRILRAMQSFKEDQVLYREPPLHIVGEQDGNIAFEELKLVCQSDPKAFEYEPLWYWAALCSLTAKQMPHGESRLKHITEEQQRNILLLYRPEVTEPSDAGIRIVHELGLAGLVDPVIFESLLQTWVFNCFEHSESPLSYSIYFLPSFTAHSCGPNLSWTYDGDDFVVRARQRIEQGAEVTLSYLTEGQLREPVARRRHFLEETKLFLCSCTRCVAETPDQG